MEANVFKTSKAPCILCVVKMWPLTTPGLSSPQIWVVENTVYTSKLFVIDWVIMAIFLFHNLNIMIFTCQRVLRTWIFWVFWTEPAMDIITSIIDFHFNSSNKENTLNDNSKIMLGAETWRNWKIMFAGIQWIIQVVFTSQIRSSPDYKMKKLKNVSLVLACYSTTVIK